MAILHGYINLGKIDKSLITTNSRGDKILWVDIYTYDKADQYGNTACLATYDSRTKTKAYLANFRPKELKQAADAPLYPDNNDLGF